MLLDEKNAHWWNSSFSQKALLGSRGCIVGRAGHLQLWILLFFVPRTVLDWEQYWLHQSQLTHICQATAQICPKRNLSPLHVSIDMYFRDWATFDKFDNLFYFPEKMVIKRIDPPKLWQRTLSIIFFCDEENMSVVFIFVPLSSMYMYIGKTKGKYI